MFARRFNTVLPVAWWALIARVNKKRSLISEVEAEAWLVLTISCGQRVSLYRYG